MITANCYVSTNQPHTFNTNWFCQLMGIALKKEKIRGDGNPRCSRAQRLVEGKSVHHINVTYLFSRQRFVIVLSREKPETSDGSPQQYVVGPPVNWYVAAGHCNDFYESSWFCNLIGVRIAPRRAHISFNIAQHEWFRINVGYYSSKAAYNSPIDHLTFYCKAYEIAF